MSLVSPNRSLNSKRKFFYGWWIVVAAFLNLFCSTGVIYYGFPVFYPSLVSSLGFTRAQVTQGFLLGFIVIGLPFGYLAGILIDKIGARRVILYGVAFISVPLFLMGFMTKLWQYETLCLCEVLGYVFAGPIANQVLIARWFRLRRGRAMGLAYLGLGLGGVISPPLANFLIRILGWRYALEAAGVLILLVLLPIGLGVTRSAPEDKGLLPDGDVPGFTEHIAQVAEPSTSVIAAVKTMNFWLILIGSALVIGAINTVIQHFILFLQDHGYSRTVAAHFLSGLLASSLAGRVLVGYIVDRVSKKNAMAFFYLIIGSAIPLLLLAGRPVAAWSFVVVFGFAMGADYMLIPLVAAESFGVASLGKLLALIIMGYSVGQWVAPWIAGLLFDRYHNYDTAWKLMAASGVLGAMAIYAVATPKRRPLEVWNASSTSQRINSVDER
jgi:MFS family permease